LRLIAFFALQDALLPSASVEFPTQFGFSIAADTQVRNTYTLRL
jgi:hypothetical protein